MFIFLLIINYFVFIYHGRYKNIVNYYQMENDENFIYGKSIILIYVILSTLGRHKADVSRYVMPLLPPA